MQGEARQALRAHLAQVLQASPGLAVLLVWQWLSVPVLLLFKASAWQLAWPQWRP